MKHKNAGDYVARCAGLAALLEVSAYPKPGNVHRTSDFDDTRYEHFLASSVSIMPVIRNISLKANRIENTSKDWSDLNIGDYILRAVRDMLKWQRGGNVHLGIILLFTPLAAAAGGAYINDVVDLKVLRAKLKKVILGSLPSDSVSIYDAIDLSMTKKVLGSVKTLNVLDKSSRNQLIKRRLTPLDVFEICSNYDSICSEWTSFFDITFNESFPFLQKQLEKYDLNSSIVNTYLHILANHLDTLVVRKNGKEKAREISNRAKEVLEFGGATTKLGSELLSKFDKELQIGKGKLNPGTSADLTASSLFLLTLNGWRP
jgi:triphosphoribosyl-dephospho-CoA synthase